MIGWVLLLCFETDSILYSQVQKKASHYVVSAWQSENGLPGGVLTVMEDKTGMLWLGTYEGVFQFDGLEFKKVQTRFKEPLKPYIVRALIQDSQERIWIGTTGNGLVLYTPDSIRVFGVEQGLPDENISTLFLSKSNELWIGTRKGLAKLDATLSTSALYVQTAKDDSLLSFFSGKEIRAIEEGGLKKTVSRDSAEYLWFGTDFTGLYAVKRGETKTTSHKGDFTLVHHFTEQEGLPSNTISSLKFDDRGYLWVGGLKGVSCLTTKSIDPLKSLPDKLQGHAILSLHLDRSGTLWIGSTEGVFAVSAHPGRPSSDYQVLYFGEGEGLSSSEVVAVSEDRVGNIWVGTARAGVCRIKNGIITTLTTDDGLAGNSVYALCEADNGALWIGAYGGLHRVEGNGKITVQREQNGLPSDVIRTVTRDRRDNLWVGTFGRGLFKLGKKGRFEEYGVEEGLPSRAIRSTVLDSLGRLWVGTRRGLAYWNEKTQRFETKSFEGYPMLSINTLTHGKKGIWVGSDGAGLFLVTETRHERFDESNGLSSNFVFSVYEDATGAVWIGTKGGLMVLREESLIDLSVKHDLLKMPVFQLVEDDEGTMWLGTAKGILRVSKEALLSAHPIETIWQFGKMDGMRSEMCSVPANAIMSKNGVLLFPTSKGVSILDPKRISRSDDPERPLIKELSTQSEAFYLPQAHPDLFLDEKTTRVVLSYTAVNFDAPTRVSFRYRLRGFDDEWSPITQSRQVSYTNLPHGTYIFDLQASDIEGNWGDKLNSLTFTIRPKYYETGGFKLLFIVMIATLLYSGYRWRLRAQRARQKELELLLNERTEKLREEKEKAEAIQKEAEQARREAEQERERAIGADKLKTELLAIAAHDLKNPLQSISGFADLLKEKLTPLTEDTVEGKSLVLMAETIKRASDRMFLIVTELLQTAAVEDRGLSLMVSRTNVTQLFELVAEPYYTASEVKGQRLMGKIAEPFYASVDPEKFYAALENLISNAVKYTPNGKTIEYGITRLNEPKHLVGISNTTLLFYVRDEGQGLNDRDKANLFRRFQKLSAKPTGGESSTGLGLSIVKKIVDLHGGAIWAESLGEHQGATFFIELPEA